MKRCVNFICHKNYTYIFCNKIILFRVYYLPNTYMFNLCKTVKIYHTVNHYHSQPTPKDPTELQFQETPAPEPSHIDPHPSIRMVESHSVSPKKSRTGINISLKESSASPDKYSQRTQDQDLSQSQRHPSSTNTYFHETEGSSIGNKKFTKFEKCSPLIVESKITYG